MSESVNSPNPIQSSPEAQAAPADGTKASVETKTATYTMSTQIGSLSQLKDKAPKVYNAMMDGIAQSVLRSMQRHGQRMKELMRKARENDS